MIISSVRHRALDNAKIGKPEALKRPWSGGAIDTSIPGGIENLMRYSPLLRCVAALLFASALIFSGCQSGKQKPSGGSDSKSGGTQAKPRVPSGANSRHDAAVKFFNAYKTHDRQAAKEVATDTAINALVFDPAAGTNPTLQLIDDTHIYYEGGSIQLSFARNAAGRWHVRSVTSQAD